MNKPELLSPAGDLEKLKFGVKFGADALYLGGQEFSLRASAGNFSLEEIQEGIKFAQGEGARVYVAVNIIPHNYHLPRIKDYLQELGKIGPDGLIVADPSVIELARKEA
ncbi:MAG: U32 family peptidase, partial [Candidatus Syntrophonatronum acetioxidans]